jgi:hypothetical protein
MTVNKPRLNNVAVTTEPCEWCQRLCWDPPWQLVAQLEYVCAVRGAVNVSLCLHRHLAEFLVECAEAAGPSLGDRSGQCSRLEEHHLTSCWCRP